MKAKLGKSLQAHGWDCATSVDCCWINSPICFRNTMFLLCKSTLKHTLLNRHNNIPQKEKLQELITKQSLRHVIARLFALELTLITQPLIHHQGMKSTAQCDYTSHSRKLKVTHCEMLQRLVRLFSSGATAEKGLHWVANHTIGSEGQD